MTGNKSMIPVQPYLILNAEAYKGMPAGNMGISMFYEFKVEAGGERLFQAVPDGSTDLVFGIGSQDVRTYIGGTVLKIKQWEFEEGRTYFGVRFQPGKCILPGGLSIREVVDADLELDQNDYGNQLADRIARGRDILERSQLFLKYFPEKREYQDTVHVIERYVRKRIYESRGNVTIKELGRETGYSECYIRRSFEQIHGISPKVFERFVRFQNMLGSIGRESGLVGMEELAVNCGYYDQSHMMKDFKCFAGTTPEAYRNMIAERKTEFVM